MNPADTLRYNLLRKEKYTNLTLERVLDAGRTMFQDDQYISLFGFTPAQFFGNGLHILGRTAVECKVDQHAKQIAASLRHFLIDTNPQNGRFAVIDLFTGSGNLLYWVAKMIDASFVMGFESDKRVFDTTARNFQKLAFPCRLYNDRFCSQYADQLGEQLLPILLLDPPWGQGFTFEHGLDINKTEPPIPIIMNESAKTIRKRPLAFLITAHEKLAPGTLLTIDSRFKLLTRAATASSSVGTNIQYLFYSTDQT